METTQVMENENIVDERAKLLAETKELIENIDLEAENASNQAGERYLTFELEDEFYGIKIEYVIEIIGIQDITHLPGTPKYVRGLINLRGKIIPLIDARDKFNKEEDTYNERTCIVVLDVDDIVVGLVVDTIAEVITIKESEKEEAPRIGRIKANKYIHDIAKKDERVLLLVDCEKLIND